MASELLQNFYRTLYKDPNTDLNTDLNTDPDPNPDIPNPDISGPSDPRTPPPGLILFYWILRSRRSKRLFLLKKTAILLKTVY